MTNYTCQNIQGINVCSNNWSKDIPSGSKYFIDINLKLPVAISFLPIITYDNFLSQLISLGYHGTIKNFKVTTDYAYHIYITFEASSPWVYIIALAIIAIIAFIIYEITVTISSNPVMSTGTSALMIGAAVAIPIAAVAYLYSKKRKK